MAKERGSNMQLDAEQLKQVELIARVFGREMLEMGHNPTSYKRDGSVSANVRGVLAYALARTAAEAEAKGGK